MADFHSFIKKSLEYRAGTIIKNISEQLLNHIENKPIPGYHRVGSVEVDVESMNSPKRGSKHRYEVVLDGSFSVYITDPVDKDELCHSGGSFEVRVTLHHPLKKDYLEVESVEVLSICDPFEGVG